MMADESWEPVPNGPSGQRESTERSSGTTVDGYAAAVARATLHDRAVWITGPTGAGKGTLARSIHEASPRASGPLVRVDCRAGVAVLVGDDAVASGTPTPIAAMFERARGGTIVFQAMGELEDRGQLAVVQAVRKSAALRSGARLIGTGRRDLALLRRLGAMRDELYELFDGRELRVVPLRLRSEEVPSLVEGIVAEFAARDGRLAPFVTARALYLLKSFEWPGNVRQLRHVLTNIWSKVGDGCITGDDVERVLRLASEPELPTLDVGTTFAEAERELILATLRSCGGSITRTAITLGLSRRTVQYRLREYAGKVGRRQPRA